MKILLSLLLAAVTFGFAQQSFAIPVIVRDTANQIITGVKGLSVGGKLYDVQFLDGTLHSVYGLSPVFPLNASGAGELSGVLASFLNINSIGLSEIKGLTSVVSNELFIPFSNNTQFVFGHFILNSLANSVVNQDPGWWPDMVAGAQFLINEEFQNRDDLAYVKVALQLVPEPTSIILVTAGLAGIFFRRRQRQ